jgi:hypothetical protein
LEAYRAQSSGGGPGSPIEFFGGSWRDSFASLVGLNTVLQEQFPFEVVFQFSMPKIVEERAQSGSNNGGISFGLQGYSEDQLLASPNIWINSTSRVEIVIKRSIIVGNHVNDYILVRHNGTFGPNAFSLSNTAVTLPMLEGCGGTNFIQGATYNLRIRVEVDSCSAKLWLDTENEPSNWSRSVSGGVKDDYQVGLNVGLFGLLANCDSGISTGSPCLDFPDQRQSAIFKYFNINPVDNAVLEPCDDQYDDDIGFYSDTLIKKRAYWVPATSNVTRYHQVYFDGVPVYKDTHYWLDGLKLYPKDPAIFADTVATALVVIE